MANKTWGTKCEYVTAKGKACILPGLGSPPLCARHERYRPQAEPTAYNHIIDAVFQQQPIQSLFNKVNGLLNKAGGFLDQINTLTNQQQTPRIDPKIVQACAVLGFNPSTPPTIDAIKERRKELALKYHPDKGGSQEQMQAINQAADFLIDLIGKSQ